MGFTGLQCAVIEGYEELCDELVKKGADCVRFVEVSILSIKLIFVPELFRNNKIKSIQTKSIDMR